MNYMGILQQQVSLLVQTTAGTLVPFAQVLLAIFALWRLVMIVINLQLTQLDIRHYNHFNFAEPLIFMMQVAVASTMLQFYNNPLPGTSISLHQVFPYIGMQLTNIISTANANAVIQQCAAVLTGLQKPSFVNLLEVATFLMIYIDCAILQFAIFVISAFGFVALGVFTMFGPIAIAFFVTKRFNGIFWSWVENMAGFSLYAPIAAAVSFVMCGMLTQFISNNFHGVYSLANALALLPMMTALVVAFLFGILQVPAFASRLTRGGGDMGQSVMASISRSLGLGI